MLALLSLSLSLLLFGQSAAMANCPQDWGDQSPPVLRKSSPSVVELFRQHGFNYPFATEARLNDFEARFRKHFPNFDMGRFFDSQVEVRMQAQFDYFDEMVREEARKAHAFSAEEKAKISAWIAESPRRKHNAEYNRILAALSPEADREIRGSVGDEHFTLFLDNVLYEATLGGKLKVWIQEIATLSADGSVSHNKIAYNIEQFFRYYPNAIALPWFDNITIPEFMQYNPERKLILLGALEYGETLYADNRVYYRFLFWLHDFTHYVEYLGFSPFARGQALILKILQDKTLHPAVREVFARVLFLPDHESPQYYYQTVLPDFIQLSPLQKGILRYRPDIVWRLDAWRKSVKQTVLERSNPTDFGVQPRLRIEGDTPETQRQLDADLDQGIALAVKFLFEM